jgi:AraC-like DNA-binding protein
MDVLTDVLEGARMKSGLYGRLELTAPWGLSFDRAAPHFYVVTRGTCWLQANREGNPIQLGGGDLVFLPKGGRHAIKDAPSTPALPVEQAFGSGSCDRAKEDAQPAGVVRYGGGGAATTLVAGYFSTENGARNLLFDSLPPVLHVQGDAGTTVRWLEANLQFIASEMASGEPGFETIVSRLADILVVQAVRAHVAQTGGGCKGWLRALIDPQIGRALSLIHEKPEDDWTVESLASKVGMSRSAFAARFAQLVEEPPLTYLTRWRMQKATRLLETSPAGVAEVARRVGYDAEAAFSKAFKRWIGVAPGAYRRTAEARGDPEPRSSGGA